METMKLDEIAIAAAVAVATVFLAWLRPYMQQLVDALIERIKGEIGANNYAMTLEIVDQIVSAVEQTANGAKGQEKLGTALSMVEAELERQNIPAPDDSETLIGLIEARVHDFNCLK